MSTSNQTYTLITGGSEGIGYELAKQFTEHGHNVIIVARDQVQLDYAKTSLESTGVQIMTISKDLFDPEAPFELYEEIRNKNLTIDILVNNAGQGVYGLFEETDIRRELAIVQLNIASLTEALRSEVKDRGIVVTTLLPGATDTEFFNKADMESSKAVLDKDKLSDPAEVAKDGYEALMSGDDKVISGFKNKVSVTMSNMMTDSKAADMMKKQQEPVTKNKNQ